MCGVQWCWLFQCVGCWCCCCCLHVSHDTLTLNKTQFDRGNAGNAGKGAHVKYLFSFVGCKSNFSVGQIIGNDDSTVQLFTFNWDRKYDNFGPSSIENNFDHIFTKYILFRLNLNTE